MNATATMPDMAKTDSKGSINVQGRLTQAEVEELDEAANEQAIPVARAALVSYVLREWLNKRRESKTRKTGGGK